jgi:hypothetical protein
MHPEPPPESPAGSRDCSFHLSSATEFWHRGSRQRTLCGATPPRRHRRRRVRLCPHHRRGLEALRSAPGPAARASAASPQAPNWSLSASEQPTGTSRSPSPFWSRQTERKERGNDSPPRLPNPTATERHAQLGWAAPLRRAASGSAPRAGSPAASHARAAHMALPAASPIPSPANPIPAIQHAFPGGRSAGRPIRIGHG